MSGLAVLLALASSLAGGTADCGGGLISRRLPTLAVTVVSQSAGCAALLVALAIVGFRFDGRSFALGVAAGAGGGAGVAGLYPGLPPGTMGIGSPLVPRGARRPVADP